MTRAQFTNQFVLCTELACFSIHLLFSRWNVSNARLQPFICVLLIHKIFTIRGDKLYDVFELTIYWAITIKFRQMCTWFMFGSCSVLVHQLISYRAGNISSICLCLNSQLNRDRIISDRLLIFLSFLLFFELNSVKIVSIVASVIGIFAWTLSTQLVLSTPGLVKPTKPIKRIKGKLVTIWVNYVFLMNVWNMRN